MRPIYTRRASLARRYLLVLAAGARAAKLSEYADEIEQIAQAEDRALLGVDLDEVAREFRERIFADGADIAPAKKKRRKRTARTAHTAVRETIEAIAEAEGDQQADEEE